MISASGLEKKIFWLVSVNGDLQVAPHMMVLSNTSSGSDWGTGDGEGSSPAELSSGWSTATTGIRARPIGLMMGLASLPCSREKNIKQQKELP